MSLNYVILNRYEYALLTAKTEILNRETSDQVKHLKPFLKETSDDRAE